MTSSLKPLICMLLLLGAVFGGTACRQGALVSSVTEVTPREVLGFQDELLTLKGHFYPQLTLDPSQPEPTLETTFSGTMEWTEIPGQEISPPANPSVPLTLTFVDATTLQARTSGLLEPGFYRLALTDPRGNPVEVASEVLVKVSQVRPDHGVLSVPSRYVAVDESVQVRASVVKTDGSASYDNHALSVTIKGPSLELLSVIMDDLNVTQSSDADGITTIVVSGTVTPVLPEATITFKPGRESTLSIATKTEGLLHTYPDEETSLVVFPAPLTRLGVYFPDLEDTIPGCSSVPGSSEAEEALLFSAGVPTLVEVLALDNNCNLLEVTDALELLDAASGEEAPLYLGSFFTPALVNGRWSGYVLYEDLVSSRLLAVGPQGTYGSSTAFDVIPGPPRRLTVSVGEVGNDGAVEAGESFSVVVWQSDGLEHDVDITSPELLKLSDDTGTLRCSAPDIRGAYAFFEDCLITRTDNRNSVTATMEYDSPLTGDSLSFVVLAAAPTQLRFVLPASAPVAGADFVVEIQLQDAYGNVSTGDTDGMAVEARLTLGGETVGVESALSFSDGSANFNTSATLAAEGYSVVAEVPALGLSGQSAPFQVFPGPTAALWVQPCPAPDACPWQAGVGGLVTVRAVDSLGNLTPTFAQPLTVTSSLESSTFSADADQWLDGTLLLDVLLTRAGKNAVLSASAGTPSGSSLPFEILPGPFDQLIWTQQPFVAWRGEPTAVEIQAQDTYGNLVITEESELLLTSPTSFSLSPGEPTGVKAVTISLSGGRWQGPLYFYTLGGSNTLSARHASNISATTTSFPIYSRDCESLATISITANNQPEVAVACLVSRIPNPPSARVEFVATTTGTATDLVWEFGDGEGQTGKNTQRVTHDYLSAGRFLMTGYVVDNNLCATGTRLRIYTNLDNDQPVGPLTITPEASTLLAAGDSTSAVTSVSVTAYDCQGDPASATSMLTVQPELGQVVSPDADERSPGVQVKLDSRAGTTSFTYSVQAEKFGGVARLVVAASSGLADGEGRVTVLNDVVPPVVLESFPHGRHLDDVRELLIRFSEPLRGGAALQSPVIQVYSQRLGPVTVESRALDVDGTLLRLTLATTVELSDAEEERVTVTLPSSRSGASLTDLDGNRLDGDYSGLAEDAGDPYVFQFGNRLNNDAVMKLAHCEPSTFQFSPDGQDGVGSEADLLTFDTAVEASVTFDTLGLRLSDTSTGEAVAWLFWPLDVPELAFGHRFIWDGADLTGRILPNGYFEPELMGLRADQPPVTLFCLDEGETVQLLNPLDAGGLP